MPTRAEIMRFIRESNAIEGIYGRPRAEEIEEFERMMALDHVTIPDLEHFVAVYQPGARVRDQMGMDVRVGSHVPMPGGPLVRLVLEKILREAERTPLSAYETHLRYESLHPFLDGNGRSGRMLWAWQMRDLSLGFLHRWYYQTLQLARRGDG